MNPFCFVTTPILYINNNVRINLFHPHHQSFSLTCVDKAFCDLFGSFRREPSHHNVLSFFAGNRAKSGKRSIISNSEIIRNLLRGPTILALRYETRDQQWIIDGYQLMHRLYVPYLYPLRDDSITITNQTRASTGICSRCCRETQSAHQLLVASRSSSLLKDGRPREMDSLVVSAYDCLWCDCHVLDPS
jgi:hypothetical protein